jgi:hypothetical protein
MKIRHFFLDARAQLRPLSSRAVHEVLAGRVRTQAFDAGLSHEVAVASAVCDDDLIPESVYLLRVPLTDGTFTPADRLILKAFTRPDCVTPEEAVRHHLTRWPADLVRQLAVALDVPVAGLDAVLDVGGPVLVAALTGVSVARAARRLS